MSHPPVKPMHIAIVGLEGSGKTVFVSCLTHLFSDPAVGGGWYFSPANRLTYDFTTRTWETLKAGDWPAATNTGTMNQYLWQLKGPQGESHEVRVCDTPGHDIRALFSEDGIDMDAGDLATYCKSADIVLVLCNPKDFLEEADQERLRANRWSIRKIVEVVTASDKSAVCGLVFTQMDKYPHGVDGPRMFTPGIWGEFTKSPRLSFFSTACVSRTAQVEDERGKEHLVPMQDFEPQGLDRVFEWMIQACQGISDNRMQEQQQIALQQRETMEVEQRIQEIDAVLLAPPKTMTGCLSERAGSGSFWFGAGGCVVAMAYLIWLMSGNNLPFRGSETASVALGGGETLHPSSQIHIHRTDRWELGLGDGKDDYTLFNDTSYEIYGGFCHASDRNDIREFTLAGHGTETFKDVWDDGNSRQPVLMEIVASDVDFYSRYGLLLASVLWILGFVAVMYIGMASKVESDHASRRTLGNERDRLRATLQVSSTTI